ncbi:MAG TPA: prolyl oligopeptidase family serine peptidase [Pseudonocardia sp.]|jgi:dipeptidyl aminopeptidase/acylaminoacyl peptidase|nr:prolyl oligopeptidase family serine peptidase [Pseudonocardia sp.]
MSDDTFTDRRRAQLTNGPDDAPGWLTAVSCHGGGLSPDGRLLAYISDRDGLPALWIAPMPESAADDADSRAVHLHTGTGYVRQVSWSPDGAWLACQVAPYGGEDTRVLVLRPDGRELRELAGGPGVSGVLGSWRMDATGLGISEAGQADPEPTAFVADPNTGRRTRLISGPAATVCSFSPDGRHAVVRVGRRGARELMLVHVVSGRTTPVLPSADATIADARFSVDGSRLYVHTDCGRNRPALLMLPFSRGGLRRDAYARHAVLAARRDADLDAFALCGATIAAVWNVDGRSELELLEAGTRRRRLLEPPAAVINSVSFAGDLSWLLVRAEGPAQPPHLVRYPLRGVTPTPRRVVPAAPAPRHPDPVSPTQLRFTAPDGLELSGWWYAPSHPVGAAVLWLHGGPESQERPTFAPLHQSLVEAGIGVFGLNVRGSSGYGKAFVNADNGDRRFAAISDVAAAARFLTESGLAAEDRVGVTGRSYGGYLTLAALVRYPELFRAGVDVCGMADLETFFRNTEPWIADAATSKYGDPKTDHQLLRDLSPMHRIDRLRAPLLVVHGRYDTNVPLDEAEQVVAALRERGTAPSYLLFPDEGHEVMSIRNRVTFVRTVVRFLTSHLLQVTEQTA